MLLLLEEEDHKEEVEVVLGDQEAKDQHLEEEYKSNKNKTYL